jgi:glycosyltransferase involved in cell wall biosynthesis
MAHTVVVVPCYNEARRLAVDLFRQHAAAANGTRFLFVDDGSQDDTSGVIRPLCEEQPATFDLLSLPCNVGKAEAVRQGFLKAFDMKPARVAFWDADLATPLGALPEFQQVLGERPDVDMVFGARVQLLGRQITRHAWRHYIGRCFATVVSIMLRMPIYDTQCGAKMFRRTPLLEEVFQQPFLSRWVFDVEIIARFARLRRVARLPPAQEAIYELPLKRWTDIAGSKLKWTDFFKAMADLARIYRAYGR